MPSRLPTIYRVFVAAVVASQAIASIGCAARGSVDKRTMGWVQVETDDLRIRTNIDQDDAVELAKTYQALRSAIAENELPCAFERSNAPMELVIFADEQEIESIGRRYDTAFTTDPPSPFLDAKRQLVISRRDAGSYTQLFATELTYGATYLCLPDAPPWLAEGLASFYSTARVEGDELVIGMPRFVFVEMDNVAPGYDIYDVHSYQAVVTIVPRRLAPEFSEIRRLSDGEFYRRNREYRSPGDLGSWLVNEAGSWLAVHLFQLGAPDLTPRFERYLGELAKGEPHEIAWNTAFRGVDVGARYRKYLKADYNMGRRPISPRPHREPIVSSLSASEAALLWARLFGWPNDERAEEAREYLDFARAVEPDSPAVLLHSAAFARDRGRHSEADRWLARALDVALNDPEVLATAIRWYAGPRLTSTSRLTELTRWGERLEASAETAFQFTELGEYALRVEKDPKTAIRWLNKALALDAGSWRAYALAGSALEELGRTDEAVRAYYTALGLSGDAPATLRRDLRQSLQERIFALEEGS